jgi:predicted DNA-binding protein YlxM (UPF0122 family)
MDKKVYISILMGFYGKILTSKQRRAMELYYSEDLSLSEIAECEGITRQGVRDALVRAENALYKTEEKLGIVKKYLEFSANLRNLAEELSAKGDKSVTDRINSLLLIWEEE